MRAQEQYHRLNIFLKSNFFSVIDNHYEWDPNQINQIGDSPIHRVINETDSLSLLTNLVELNADINKKGSEALTAFEIAVKCNKINEAHFLFDNHCELFLDKGDELNVIHLLLIYYIGRRNINSDEFQITCNQLTILSDEVNNSYDKSAFRFDHINYEKALKIRNLLIKIVSNNLIGALNNQNDYKFWLQNIDDIELEIYFIANNLIEDLLQEKTTDDQIIEKKELILNEFQKQVKESKIEFFDNIHQKPVISSNKMVKLKEFIAEITEKHLVCERVIESFYHK